MSTRTILVTGAANGIGRAVSKALAAEDATIILLDKDLKGLEAVYDEIEGSGAPCPAIYPMDLAGASGDDYTQLAMTLMENFPAIDGLLLNAATLGIMSRIDDYDSESWFKVIQTNLNAPFFLTQALLPLLRKSQRASVLLSADGVGRLPKAYWGAYAVSKAGAETLMMVLADELENSSIRVNTFNPGPTRTGLRHQAFPAEDSSKLQTPESLAAAYCYLMGDQHDFRGKQLSLDDLQLPA